MCNNTSVSTGQRFIRMVMRVSSDVRTAARTAVARRGESPTENCKSTMLVGGIVRLHVGLRVRFEMARRVYPRTEFEHVTHETAIYSY